MKKSIASSPRRIKKTEDILNSHMSKLHETAAYLMKHEKMSGDVFAEVMAGTYVEPVEVEESPCGRR